MQAPHSAAPAPENASLPVRALRRAAPRRAAHPCGAMRLSSEQASRSERGPEAPQAGAHGGGGGPSRAGPGRASRRCSPHYRNMMLRCVRVHVKPPRVCSALHLPHLPHLSRFFNGCSPSEEELLSLPELWASFGTRPGGRTVPSRSSLPLRELLTLPDEAVRKVPE